MKISLHFTVLVILFNGSPSLVESASCSCNCNDGGSSCPKTQYYTSAKRLVKQCVFKSINDDTDVGVLTKLSCDFNKEKTDTSLRVTFNGVMRVIGCSSGCCRRWFITINGKECKDPATIDSLIWANGYVNRHIPGIIDGICNNIPAGQVKVGLSIAACSGVTGGNGYTGWNSVSRILIEEMSI
ncbi:collagen triple helix repeat-containing protein 1-like isoform X1 [Xenia sp. Carnegie-2017]|uniref:collagen triple helix repeat-containing protein 1-like isoform X1 n=1 Tax=Xenia sp. Carnegie-2017 TaxID=2897299 RepID=UPI001F041FAC|nr:collagen triple helix repeat-containing protein 1-like isoform X1 [Xenia sp. Carnegie-2017]